MVDIDPEKIKPERLYKILRYPFKFNHFDLTINQLEERFALQKEMTSNEEESSKGMDNCTSQKNTLDSSWIKRMINQLNSYDSVQKTQQKYAHLPKGLDSKREVYLVSTILGGNFTTKSLDQLCQNISYQPFTIHTYSNCFQIMGDCVSSSGLLIDFSQIPAVYQAQIDKILPKTKCGPIRVLSPYNDCGKPVRVKYMGLYKPIVVRFHNLVITSTFLEKSSISLERHERLERHSKTILESYVYGTDQYSGTLTSTLLSLNEELFKHAMYKNNMLKDHKELGIYRGSARINMMDCIDFNGIIKPTHDNFDHPTGWTLGFRIPSPHVIHGEISSSMIVDIDLIFKGWTTDGNGCFGSRKLIKSLTVRKNLSPILKPGKEVIGQPWKKSYSTRSA